VTPPGFPSSTPSLLPLSSNSVAFASSSSSPASCPQPSSPSYPSSSSSPHQVLLGRSFAMAIRAAPMSGQRPPSVGAAGAPRQPIAPTALAAVQQGPRQAAPVVTPLQVGRPPAQVL
jgi:hypothetical protein